jgi:hypothetical protein
LAQLRPDTKFLFVSGYAGRTVLDRKVVDLETNFLQKPYSLKQLSQKIRSALDQNSPVIQSPDKIAADKIAPGKIAKIAATCGYNGV